MRALFCLLVALPLLAKSPFVFRDLSPASVELTERGKPVLVYNYGMMLKPGMPEDRRRCCYMHPVYSPGGTVLTDDFPIDHPHHRGISWMWPHVTIAGTPYDLWTIRGIHQQFVRWTRRETGPHSATLAVENGWFVGDRKVLKETAEIVVRPAQGRQRDFDVTLSFTALERPIEIRGADEKGYGGLGVRFAPREKTVLTTDQGTESGDSNMAPHPWAQLEALFQGRPAGLRVDVDPSNAGAPNGWCLRHYGYLGVNFPGLATYRLEPGVPYKLKYKVTVFDR
jgi:hypothetical protein